jgi:hypothetical protein
MEDAFLPELLATSEVATKVPVLSFQIERYTWFMMHVLGF